MKFENMKVKYQVCSQNFVLKKRKSKKKKKLIDILFYWTQLSGSIILS